MTLLNNQSPALYIAAPLLMVSVSRWTILFLSATLSVQVLYEAGRQERANAF